jgi:hypothetical protein
MGAVRFIVVTYLATPLADTPVECVAWVRRLFVKMTTTATIPSDLQIVEC